MINNDAINKLSLTDTFSNEYEPQNIFRRLLERSSSREIIVFVLIHSSCLTKYDMYAYLAYHNVNLNESSQNIVLNYQEANAARIAVILFDSYPTSTIPHEYESMLPKHCSRSIGPKNGSPVVSDCSKLLLAPMIIDTGCLFCSCVSNSTPFRQISVFAVPNPLKYHSQRFSNYSEGISPKL